MLPALLQSRSIAALSPGIRSTASLIFPTYVFGELLKSWHAPEEGVVKKPRDRSAKMCNPIGRRWGDEGPLPGRVPSDRGHSPRG
jgi:hypothetical protein